MKVTINHNRILHLFLLVVCTHFIARFLIRAWRWTPLSAYGLACTITTQVSNAIMGCNVEHTNGGIEDKEREVKGERVLMKRKARRSGLAAGTKRK